MMQLRSQEGRGIAFLVFKPSFPRSESLGQEDNLDASDSEDVCSERATEPFAGDAPDLLGSSDFAREQVAPHSPSRTSEPAPAIKCPQDGSPADPSALRVLLAEDNRDLQQILARRLRFLELEVVAAMNGREAVILVQAASAAKKPFDLILMDIEMPIIDGYEATRQIRESGFSGPILALSAHTTAGHRQECIKIGCNDCIAKPIDWTSLNLLIRKHVARSPTLELFPSPNR